MKPDSEDYKQFQNQLVQIVQHELEVDKEVGSIVETENFLFRINLKRVK